MAARLTSTSIVFSDNTTLTSYYDIIPKGTVTIFYQSYLPLGWSLVNTQNDKTFRVVSGSGGGQFGSRDFSTLWNPISVTSPATLNASVGDRAIEVRHLPSHTHTTPDGTTVRSGSNIAAGNGFQKDNFSDASTGSGTASGASLSGGSHNHPFSSQNITYSYNLDFNVYYMDVILAKFN